MEFFYKIIKLRFKFLNYHHKKNAERIKKLHIVYKHKETKMEYKDSLYRIMLALSKRNDRIFIKSSELMNKHIEHSKEIIRVTRKKRLLLKLLSEGIIS